MLDFDEWFQIVTKKGPFPFQRRFAETSELPQLVDVPTDCCKTAMAILGWLWRMRFLGPEPGRPVAIERPLFPGLRGM